MKNIAKFLIASAALVGSQVANAATFSPTGTWVFEGTATVYKGIELDCDVKLTVVTTSSTAAATIELSGGFLGLCSTVTFPETPAGGYSVTYDGTASPYPEIKLTNVFADTITPGDCRGDLVAEWDDSSNANTIYINDTLEEASTGTGDCIISNGLLTLTSPGDVTIS